MARFRPGDRVVVGEGSGLDSGKHGEIRPFGERTWHDIEGEYKAPDRSREVLVRLDDGRYTHMFKNRVSREDGGPKASDGRAADPGPGSAWNRASITEREWTVGPVLGLAFTREDADKITPLAWQYLPDSAREQLESRADLWVPYVAGGRFVRIGARKARIFSRGQEFDSLAGGRGFMEDAQSIASLKGDLLEYDPVEPRRAQAGDVAIYSGRFGIRGAIRVQTRDQENEAAREGVAAPPPPTQPTQEFIVLVDTQGPEPEAVRVHANSSQEAEATVRRWWEERSVSTARVLDSFHVGSMRELIPGTSQIRVTIDPVAGTDAEDWFVVKGGPPGDEKPYTAYSMDEARAIRRDREAQARALGYKVVHVDSYDRDRNGRTESVRDHDRRQIVRGDESDPGFRPLRRRRRP